MTHHTTPLLLIIAPSVPGIGSNAPIVKITSAVQKQETYNSRQSTDWNQQQRQHSQHAGPKSRWQSARPCPLMRTVAGKTRLPSGVITERVNTSQ